jgi:hypothetical protein
MTEEKPTVDESNLGERQYPAVDAGTGSTATREGAHAKEVHNVSSRLPEAGFRCTRN